MNPKVTIRNTLLTAFGGATCGETIFTLPATKHPALEYAVAEAVESFAKEMLPEICEIDI
jgi:hypothetical protein